MHSWVSILTLLIFQSVGVTTIEIFVKLEGGKRFTPTFFTPYVNHSIAIFGRRINATTSVTAPLFVVGTTCSVSPKTSTLVKNKIAVVFRDDVNCSSFQDEDFQNIGSVVANSGAVGLILVDVDDKIKTFQNSQEKTLSKLPILGGYLGYGLFLSGSNNVKIPVVLVDRFLGNDILGLQNIISSSDILTPTVCTSTTSANATLYATISDKGVLQDAQGNSLNAKGLALDTWKKYNSTCPDRYKTKIEKDEELWYNKYCTSAESTGLATWPLLVDENALLYVVALELGVLFLVILYNNYENREGCFYVRKSEYFHSTTHVDNPTNGIDMTELAAEPDDITIDLDLQQRKSIIPFYGKVMSRPTQSEIPFDSFKDSVTAMNRFQESSKNDDECNHKFVEGWKIDSADPVAQCSICKTVLGKDRLEHELEKKKEIIELDRRAAQMYSPSIPGHTNRDKFGDDAAAGDVDQSPWRRSKSFQGNQDLPSKFDGLFAFEPM